MNPRCSFATAMFAIVAIWHATGAEAQNGGWQLLRVPGATNFNGFAWYRSWVKVPDSYFAAHERNLFEESVGIYIRDLAGAHEAWVNGQKIGTAGAFPPDYRSSGSVIHRHKVPTGTLRKGAWNEIAVRVYNPAGPGGFRADAPFIMDYFMECTFQGMWEFRLGDAYKPGGAVTNKPGAATFEHFRE